MSSSGSTTGACALVEETHNGVVFPKLHLRHPSGRSSVEVYLYGANITSFKILGNEILFVSDKVVFAPGKSIRGGIPIVFPQFGPGKLPQHGFARRSVWTHTDTSVNKTSGDISATLVLTDNEETRKEWDYKFKLSFTIMLKITSLSMQLKVENLDDKPFDFTTLLHTYLHVEDISKTTIRGLQHFNYIDQLDGRKVKEDRSESVIFEGEVDRIYTNVGTNSVRVGDGGNCEILVKATGFKDCVVWNPWINKSAGMNDMSPEGYRKMVCVENGTVAEPVSLEPNNSWEGAIGLSLQVLPETETAAKAKI